MKHLWNFTTGFILCFLFVGFFASGSTDASTSLVVATPDKKQIVLFDAESIKLILSTVGGIVSTVILTILRKKFPKLFRDTVRVYSKRPRP